MHVCVYVLEGLEFLSKAKLPENYMHFTRLSLLPEGKREKNLCWWWVESLMMLQALLWSLQKQIFCRGGMVANVNRLKVLNMVNMLSL